MEPTTQLIPVRTSGEMLTVSSVDFANGLGIQHRSLLETIRSHQKAIETEFGRVTFETQPFQTGGGIQNKVIVHLTEDQALFIGTLSRNSQRVVAFKATLVRSFSEARRQLREVAQPLYLQQQEQRLAHLEQQLSQMIESQQQAARSLLELPRSSDPLPVETTRMKIQRIVNNYCRAKGVGQQEVWRKVYDRLYYLYHVSIRSYKRSDRESWLDVADRSGHMEKLYAIVSAELTYTED
ncbi:hypothetical protein GO755_24795 [Spirosoma sp. HMF4905]|uniref:Rha family transcriptional regulator n=1 Tax=Spirosoma arboris TaxID=2682092 RepID=A0A7K1SHK7_9BACT|nr:Rha family transcriptional regulator [Spirosoma arboris]MVM33282.1 hypothetical protein [Spirosoma arboris]